MVWFYMVPGMVWYAMAWHGKVRYGIEKSYFQTHILLGQVVVAPGVGQLHTHVERDVVLVHGYPRPELVYSLGGHLHLPCDRETRR